MPSYDACNIRLTVDFSLIEKLGPHLEAAVESELLSAYEAKELLIDEIVTSIKVSS